MKFPSSSGKLSCFITAVLSTSTFSSLANCTNSDSTGASASNSTELHAPASCQNNTIYPDRCKITNIFNHLAQGNFDAFFEHVADDVHWTLMGTHPLAGQYHNRTILIVDAIERLANTLDPSQPTTLVPTSVIGGGNEEWSVQELHALGVCKNGLIYDNKFVWITRWNTDGIIVQTHAYFDSALVQKVITENESEIFNYTQPRDKLMPGPKGSNCKE